MCSHILKVQCLQRDWGREEVLCFFERLGEKKGNMGVFSFRCLKSLSLMNEVLGTWVLSTICFESSQSSRSHFDCLVCLRKKYF